MPQTLRTRYRELKERADREEMRGKVEENRASMQEEFDRKCQQMEKELHGAKVRRGGVCNYCAYVCVYLYICIYILIISLFLPECPGNTPFKSSSYLAVLGEGWVYAIQFLVMQCATGEHEYMNHECFGNDMAREDDMLLATLGM